MVSEQDPGRIAATESLFREVNERIAEAAERFDAKDAEFICECGDPSCTTRVEATLHEYEQVRDDGATFLLSLGHEDEQIETVVEEKPDHAVVRKIDPRVVPLVLELDPRAA